MSERGQQILHQALSLDSEERLEVAELLLSSLDSASRHRIDALWATEVEERVNAFDRGEVRSISAQETFGEIAKQDK